MNDSRLCTATVEQVEEHLAAGKKMKLSPHASFGTGVDQPEAVTLSVAAVCCPEREDDTPEITLNLLHTGFILM